MNKQVQNKENIQTPLRIKISILNRTLQLYNKEMVEIATNYFPYIKYKENVEELVKNRIFRETIRNVVIYYIYDIDNNRIIVYRDDERDFENMLKRVRGEIVRVAVVKLNLNRFGVVEFDDGIHLIENDMVFPNTWNFDVVKLKMLPQIIMYHAMNRGDDNKVNKEVKIPWKSFINVVVFALKFDRESNLDDKVKMLYEIGKSIREIAEEMGLTYSKVRYMLVKKGVVLRKNRIPNDIRNMIIEMGKNGIAVYKIAEELKLNEVTVLTNLRRENVVKRKKKMSVEEIEMIEKMYKEGKSIYEISKKLNRSTNLVVYYLKKMGLKM